MVRREQEQILNRNEEVCLTIEDMSDEGLGIGHAGGMALFVKDAVVGDTVRAKVVKVKKNYAYARTEEVIAPSPDRVPARCPVARSCGGCQVQEMSYPAQLRLKEARVRSHLTRIGGFDPDMEIMPVMGMEDPWHYRNKAQFPVGAGRDGAPAAGFYAGRTHSIIDCRRCRIGIGENEAVLEAVLAWMQKYHVRPYEEKDGSGTIRHVMTRAGFATGQMMVVIVAAEEHLPAEERLTEALREAVEGTAAEKCRAEALREAAEGQAAEKCRAEALREAAEERKDRERTGYRLTGIVLNINTERTNVILGRKSRVLYGQDHIEDRIADLTFRISSRSFYQVNPVQTGRLYETVLEYAGLTGSETVWDLYCGIGTISLFLARHAGKVIGVEVVPDAVRNAERNASLNQIDNCRFIAGRAEDVAIQLERADVITVDPPRKGLDRVVVDTILRSAPSRIVYVSCNSATLARDLRLFADGGYEIRKVQPVDMFPHTVHVETVVLLTRNT